MLKCHPKCNFVEGVMSQGGFDVHSGCKYNWQATTTDEGACTVYGQQRLIS